MWAENALTAMGFLTTVNSQEYLKSLSSHNIHRTNEIKLFVPQILQDRMHDDIGNTHRGMPVLALHADGEYHFLPGETGGAHV